MDNLESLIGKRVRFTHSHVLQTVAFDALIVGAKLNAYGLEIIRLRIPKGVAALPFPPFGGKPFVWLKLVAVEKSIH